MTSRIVVTGAGAVTPIGIGLDAFERALFSGDDGLSRSRELSAPDDRETAVYQVREFDARQWLGRKGLRVLDRSARFISVAAHLALESSGLHVEEAGDPGLGLVNGTLFGSVRSITAFDWSGVADSPRYVNPGVFPNTVINSPAGQAAIKHGLRGVNSTVSAGLASGLHAIQYGADFLAFGRAEAILAGGADESCREAYLGFYKNGYLSAQGSLRPFAASRDGSVLGEGSALLTLETAQRAADRGRKPLAELCGFGEWQDAPGGNGFRQGVRGAAQAIRNALGAARISPGEIGLIVSGAAGLPRGDRLEALALSRVFGDRLPAIPLSAPKAAFGEAQGASGALLALTAVLSLGRCQAAPTAGFVDSEYDLSLSSLPQPLQGDYALITSFGCDGYLTAMIVGRWTD